MPNVASSESSFEEVEKKLEDVNLDSNEVNLTSKRRKEPLSFLRGCIPVSGDVYRDYTPEKIFMLGEKGSGLKSRGELQDFHLLKQELLSDKELFEDSTFPNTSSIRTDRDDDTYVENIEWKRPKEISDDPRFFVDGGSRFDIKQGEFGDCWLLASISRLAMHPLMLDQVVPKDQSFEDEEYAGIFHFRFWHFGRWIDVVIDDFLPTKDGELVCAHSSTKNEFWSPLLVKAYAKLYGSWEVIDGGWFSEATEDFSGGITREYTTDDISSDLFKILLKDQQRNAFMGCTMKEKRKKHGLVTVHMYTITKVYEYENFRLLRLRNPWGDATEWKGAWSDNSKKWKYISASEKKELDLTFAADGEFWMSFEDFQEFVSNVEVCYLNPSSAADIDAERKWKTYAFEGEWVRGVTAGGDETSMGTFSQNPQYSITIDSLDDESDKCTVIVALMQKHRRAKSEEDLELKFAIYALKGNGDIPKPLNTDYLASNSRVDEDACWASDRPREFTCRIELSPGSYCIIPYTSNPHEEGEFLLRVFCDGPASMVEYDDEIGEMENGKKGKMIRNHGLSDEEAESLFADFKETSEDKLEKKWKQLKETLCKDLNEGWNYGFNFLHYGYRFEFKEPRNNLIEIGFQRNPVPLLHVVDLGILKKVSMDFSENMLLCNMVILMHKLDSGKLGFDAYNALQLNIKEWRDVFDAYDADGCGYFRTFELRGALNSAGYRVNKQVLNALVHRYQEESGRITWDEFVMCALKLKTMIGELQEEKLRVE